MDNLVGDNLPASRSSKSFIRNSLRSAQSSQNSASSSIRRCANAGPFEDEHAQGKPADAPLLGPVGEPIHTRSALRYRLKLLCKAADVPFVCPHSLRGLNATLALEAGATAQHVAAALGHSSFTTTARHYADASTLANANLRKVADVLNKKAAKTFDVQQLASLLRENLSQEQLLQLREKLVA